MLDEFSQEKNEGGIDLEKGLGELLCRELVEGKREKWKSAEEFSTWLLEETGD